MTGGQPLLQRSGGAAHYRIFPLPIADLSSSASFLPPGAAPSISICRSHSATPTGHDRLGVRAMFEGWENFFLMAGGAAAVLIGLIFVVISFLGDRPRDSVLAGSRLYMGPIVLGVSFVLTLSAAALTPGITLHAFAGITMVIAIWGLIRAVMSTWGIGRLNRIGNEKVHWTD